MGVKYIAKKIPLTAQDRLDFLTKMDGKEVVAGQADQKYYHSGVLTYPTSKDEDLFWYKINDKYFFAPNLESLLVRVDLSQFP